MTSGAAGPVADPPRPGEAGGPVADLPRPGELAGLPRQAPRVVVPDPDGGEVLVELLGAGPFGVEWRWGERRPTGRRELSLSIRYDGAAPAAATVRVSRSVTATGDPWWLIPGLFYGENRPADCQRVFPASSRAPTAPRRWSRPAGASAPTGPPPPPSWSGATPAAPR
ncbi:hypothetical protein ACFQ0B_31390 [Nonomuraea thailandensis]